MTPSATFDSPGAETVLGSVASKVHHDPQVGDAEKAFADAPVKIDARYATPTQHHNPMELFTTTCAWNGPKLTVWEPTQNVYGLRFGLASQLGVDADDVHVISPYVGGAFGSRGAMTQRTAIIAFAARRIGRPVKLVATRSQGFTIASFRAETRHHVKLGADRDGHLQSLSHEGWEVTSRPDPYMVAGTDATTRLYASPNVASKVSIVHADRNTPGFMRAPAEVPYMFALESAMDELAIALDMDPIALRRINDTMVGSIKGLPYTSRSLMKCFDAGAEAFGWRQRSPKPGSMQDGDWLIGLGCATTLYPTQISPAAARVTLTPQGQVLVQTAAHDIGNGAYTVVALTAADRLGVTLDRITVQLGDSDLPPAPVAGGSNTTASVCNVVAKACDEIVRRLAQGAIRRSLFSPIRLCVIRAGAASPCKPPSRACRTARSRSMRRTCRRGPSRMRCRIWGTASRASSAARNCLIGWSSPSAPSSSKSASTRRRGKSAAHAWWAPLRPAASSVRARPRAS
jgi:xanthine dehydrogenase YagR molybdenum-binding subunit